MKFKTIFNIIIILICLIIFSIVSKLLGIALIILSMVYISLPLIFLYTGNVYYSKSEFLKASKYFRIAYSLPNSSLKMKLNYGNFLLLRGDMIEAEKMLKAILKEKLSTDEEIKTKSIYSILLWKSDQLTNAIELLESLHSSYKNTMVYQNLGYFLILKGNYAESLIYNLEAYEYNNSDAGIIDNLALNYFMVGNYQKSTELYEDLMTTNPTFAAAYYNYALTLLHDDKLKEALVSLGKALNCKFSFISIVSKEEIEAKITEINQEIINEKSKA